MKKIIKNIMTSVAVMSSIAFYCVSATAQMPQTDVDFVNQMNGSDDEKITALGEYYNLHVSELEVQLITEQNTGAFLGSKRAEREGDMDEAKRLNDMYEGTKALKEKMVEENRQIRKRLGEISKIEFSSKLVMAPEGPDDMPKIPDGTPKNLSDAVNAAWSDLLIARKKWDFARMELLEGQEKYNNGEKNIHIGDLMRDVTSAEIALARSAGDLRLAVARMAVAAGKPIVDTLAGL